MIVNGKESCGQQGYTLQYGCSLLVSAVGREEVCQTSGHEVGQLDLTTSKLLTHCTASGMSDQRGQGSHPLLMSGLGMSDIFVLVYTRLYIYQGVQ